MRLFPSKVDTNLLSLLRLNADNAILITPPRILVHMEPLKLPNNVRPNEELMHKGVFLTGGPAPFFYWDGKFIETRVAWCSDVICSLDVKLRNPLSIPIQLRRVIPYAVDATTGLEVLDMVSYTQEQVVELPVQFDRHALTVVTIRMRPVKSVNVIRILGFKALWNGQLILLYRTFKRRHSRAAQLSQHRHRFWR